MTRANDPIAQLVPKAVSTVRPTATLFEAAATMASDGVGLLVLVDPSGVGGVISERDIVAAIADGRDLELERVRDVATTDLLTVEEDVSVLEAARAMRDADVRHLTVARKGVITGVVSMRDVVKVLLDEL